MSDPLDNYRPALAKDAEDTNEAIRLPMYLVTPDGRRFPIREWHPHAKMPDLVTVTIEAEIWLEGRKR